MNFGLHTLNARLYGCIEADIHVVTDGNRVILQAK